MSVQDTPQQELWGGETRKAVDNFPVSGERVPVEVVRWLGRIKGAAARANAELGLLDDELAKRIAEEALDLLPDAQLRVLPRTGFLIAYDDPVGVGRELAAFCA